LKRRGYEPVSVGATSKQTQHSCGFLQLVTSPKS
jgi:hypothetical protein